MMAFTSPLTPTVQHLFVTMPVSGWNIWQGVQERTDGVEKHHNALFQDGQLFQLSLGASCVTV